MDFRRNSESDPEGGDVELQDAYEVQPLAAAGGDDVTECLSFLARRYERPSSPVIIRAGLALNEQGHLPFHQVESALEQIGLRGETFSGKLSRLKAEATSGRPAAGRRSRRRAARAPEWRGLALSPRRHRARLGRRGRAGCLLWRRCRHESSPIRPASARASDPGSAPPAPTGSGARFGRSGATSSTSGSPQRSLTCWRSRCLCSR